MNEKDPAVGSYGGVNPVTSGIAGRCPRCGKGPLFDGYLNIAKSCSACDLDNDYVDSADAPAVLVILLAGFLIVCLALIVELKYQPSYWVHAVLWLPLGILIPLGMLRPFKGGFIGLQFKNSAKEARFGKSGTKL